MHPSSGAGTAAYHAAGLFGLLRHIMPGDGSAWPAPSPTPCAAADAGVLLEMQRRDNALLGLAFLEFMRGEFVLMRKGIAIAVRPQRPASCHPAMRTVHASEPPNARVCSAPP